MIGLHGYLLSPIVSAQGLGGGIGIDDLRQLAPKAGGAVTPCATNLVFQQNVACNAVAFVMTGY
jgi:hypothetical protein